MKQVLNIFSAVLIVAVVLQSCNQPKVDTAKEWASIDSTANVKLMVYRDSLKMTCMNSVMAMASAKSDSMMKAAMSKPGKPKPKPAPAPSAAKPAPKTGLQGLSDEVKKNSGGLKSLSDQKKAEDAKKGTGGLKSLSDSAKKQPPKY